MAGSAADYRFWWKGGKGKGVGIVQRVAGRQALHSRVVAQAAAGVNDSVAGNEKAVEGSDYAEMARFALAKPTAERKRPQLGH
jgi:hypothetical protein